MDMPRHEHSHHDHHGDPGHASAAPHPGTAIDPVCGMTVDIATAKHKHSFGGSTWYFCSKHCVDKFAADPERYAKPGKQSIGAGMPGCVHLPDASGNTAARSGQLSKCGMALVPSFPQRPPNTPARCTRRSAVRRPETARNAAWRSSPLPEQRKTTPSCAT